MLNFVDVYKRYDNGTLALNKINLSINDEEFVFLVGTSGSGKSTLLKLILREELMTGGEIYFKGLELSKLDRKEVLEVRRQLGIVFQDFRLLPNKTAYENVAYAMEVVEKGERKIKKEVPRVLSLVGLSDKANRYPGELSGGEQQRIAIARAIVNEPDLIIADEPTGNLDPENSRDIIKIFEEINRSGTTVLIATHEKGIVDEMKKRVVEIDKGMIVRDEEKGFYSNEN
ncbi:MAG: cell division ATP-binding protein FtsE [Clostridiales bacterium]|nr:cell division ATP-binding protein FtsE [Clostridiales bacterium]